MTIETKLNIGQRIIVEVDSGFCKGTITDINTHTVGDAKTIISYYARINEKTTISTKNGNGTVADNREVFIVEPRAMQLLKEYKKLMQSEQPPSEDVALVRLRRIVGPYKPKVES